MDSLSSHSTVPSITEVKKLVHEEAIRVVAGVAILIVNTYLLMILNINRYMQKKFFLYTVVAIGDDIDGTYFIYASLSRIVAVATDEYYFVTNRRQCLLKLYILPRIFGTELVTVTILVLAIDKIFAVFYPVYYRLHSNRIRLYMEAVAFVYCVACTIWMFLSVLLDPMPKSASDAYCGISTSTRESFSLYHQYSQIVFNLAAFVLSVVAFSVAWSRSKISQAAKKELQLIQPILVVTAISTAILIASNVIYLLKLMGVPYIPRTVQNITVTYSSVAFTFSKIFVYLLSGKEFRMVFLSYWKRSVGRNTVGPF